MRIYYPVQYDSNIHILFIMYKVLAIRSTYINKKFIVHFKM